MEVVFTFLLSNNIKHCMYNFNIGYFYNIVVACQAK